MHIELPANATVTISVAGSAIATHTTTPDSSTTPWWLIFVISYSVFGLLTCMFKAWITKKWWDVQREQRGGSGKWAWERKHERRKHDRWSCRKVFEGWGWGRGYIYLVLWLIWVHVCRGPRQRKTILFLLQKLYGERMQTLSLDHKYMPRWRNITLTESVLSQKHLALWTFHKIHKSKCLKKWKIYMQQNRILPDDRWRSS